MKITLTADGATVDAHDLGPILGVAPADVPDLMRSGAITSLSETGADEDAGRTRLTFWYADLRIRLICDETGHVIKTSRARAPRQRISH